ncbi:MAG: HAD-IA family hydrolase [Clostridiales bacterium]|nr:HAD-IA family hydrolase [Clostridiales bacterium]
MIKAVLFDFDETLQDRTAAFEKYMAAFFGEFFPGIAPAELEKRKAEMRLTGNGGYVMANGYESRDGWYKDLIERWHWHNSPPVHELTAHYDTHFGDYCVIFPEAAPVLKQLRLMGYVTGVITNGPSVLQHHKMEKSGLSCYCDIVVVSGDIGIDKPDPEIFKYTSSRLKLECGQCVYVGDHPVNDIAAAQNAGMHPVRMNHGWFKGKNLTPGVPVIENLSELIGCINSMKYI